MKKEQNNEKNAVKGLNNKEHVYYYREITDDVIETTKQHALTPDDYDYAPDSFAYRFKSFWLFNLTKIYAFFYIHLKLHVHIKNKKLIRKYAKGTGFCLYGNHVCPYSDAYSPAIIAGTRIYTIVSPANFGVPFIGKYLGYLGGLPLGHTEELKKRFNDAIDKRLKQNRCLVIYPEAHVWPYYTKIRDFIDGSFKYPIRNNVPVFSMTTTFQKRKLGKTPRITIYLDGPFYPDQSLSFEENKKMLHDKVYDSLVKYSKYSTYEYYKYVRKGNK